LRHCLALLALLLPSAARAADRPADGLLVQIPPGVTTEATNRLRSLLYGPLKRFEAGAARQGGTFTLLCDFNPGGQRAGCDDFGACYSLASYLRALPGEIKGVRTVAYVHATVRRHSVLPVLACSEIVFSEKGVLGPVAGDKPVSVVEKTAYDVTARNRYPAALVRKLYDPAVRVLRVGPHRFAAADDRPAPVGQPVDELGGPGAAAYPFALASKLRLCQPEPAASVEEARIAYDLPRAGPQRALDRTACWRIVLDGPLTGELVEQTQRRVRRALRARATLLVLELRCAGGDAQKAYELGLFFADLNATRADNPVETIAYVTSRARNLAAFVALGCGKIVMQSEEGEASPDADDDEGPSREARLGGFDLYLGRNPDLAPLQKELADLEKRKAGPQRQAELRQGVGAARAELVGRLQTTLTDLAVRQGYPPVLAAGLVNPALRIVRVERAAGAGGQAFLSGDDFKADQRGPKKWRQVEVVKPWHDQARLANRPMTLTAQQARDVGLAQSVVKDFAELRESEGLTPAQVRTPEADWLDGLADFLREPWTSVVLVMLGITCLILELKMPGVGLPGVIAAICFVLFFWAHSQLNGQITWLALLLFVLGLVLVGVEVFVLPGFGVVGISGVLLLLVSLGLVAYGHWPQGGEEWVRFGHKMAPFSVSLLGSLALVFLVARYLPHIPVLNRLLPRPAEDGEDLFAEPEIPLHAELQALLGAIGVAATPLRPAGKTQFGDSFIDVVAEGGYIMPGTRVQVIEVEGNRVVVKEV
jgi:membrane-bound ClpP family serine protease